jgi:hypothetical protein
MPFKLADKNNGSAVTNKNESRRRLYQPQESRLVSADESYQRVGGLVVIPGLLREMGVDPTAILPRPGVEASGLDHVENRFHMCR